MDYRNAKEKKSRKIGLNRVFWNNVRVCLIGPSYKWKKQSQDQVLLRKMKTYL